MAEGSARIVLADVHALFREGVKAVLRRADMSIVGEASDGYEAVKVAKKTRPDIVILDLNLPCLNGIDAAVEVIGTVPNIHVLLLTMFSESEFVRQALKAGVRGYVLKDQAGSQLIDAIRLVLDNSIYLSPGLSEAIATISEAPEHEEVLTGRERQVLQLVAEGFSNKQAAEKLELSLKTVDSHRTRIMSKLQIHNTAGLVRYAVKRGVVTDEPSAGLALSTQQ